MEKILKYRKTHTLAETGKKFNLTSERIRQIEFIKDRKRCLKHNRFYYNKCSYCLMDKNYRAFVRKLDRESFMKEAYKEARNRKRDDMSVLRRIILIGVLYKKYKYSVSTIASVFQKDRSTIVNLIDKYIK